MRLKWSRFAISDRLTIFQYIARTSPGAALDLDDRLVRMANELLARPLMYRAGRVPGTREMVVQRNYIVIYRVSKDTVEILRVKHSAQRWP
ncbi:MAG TPA: type II toxin-antitoxin system RelE/ParE family toxin [Telluria sp.]